MSLTVWIVYVRGVRVCSLRAGSSGMSLVQVKDRVAQLRARIAVARSLRRRPWRLAKRRLFVEIPVFGAPFS